MNVKTRQRLIGFMLLLLLAAILAPLVLRSPEQVRVALNRSIPAPPQSRTPDVAPIVSDQERQDVEHGIDRQQQGVDRAGEQALAGGPTKSTQAGATPAGSAKPDAPATADASPAQAGSRMNTQTAAQTDSKSDSSPALPQAGFTVQVASFSDESNAQALVKRLKDAGYTAYYRSVQQDGNTWQRVFVGPEVKQDNAEALKQRLAADKRFALEPGLVRAFVP